MAIDNAAKRRSAIMTRRLPWFRRFQPGPDGTIDQGDRQQLAFVYRGILASEAQAPAVGHTVYTIIGARTKPYTLVGIKTSPHILIGSPDNPHSVKGQ